MSLPAKPRPSGFTLLEMIIALFILTLVLGMAIHATHTLFADEEIRQASRQLQILAKTARKQAIRENRSYEIVLLPRSWQLRPTPVDKIPDPVDANETKTYQIPQKVTWKIRPWGTPDWAAPQQSIWTFAPTGLTAPNRFRFERNDSWMEITFNPLTADPQEEAFYLP